jgi:hypothetical protein
MLDLSNGVKTEWVLLKQTPKTKRNFSPIYLGIFSGILLIILIVNGLLEINRTKNGFYRLLEREASPSPQAWKSSSRSCAAAGATSSSTWTRPMGGLSSRPI